MKNASFSGCIFHLIHFDYFKIRPLHFAQLLQFAVVPSFIRRAGDIEIAADISKYNAVFFHGSENNLHFGRETANIKIFPEPQPCAKW
jgi:hypothetical protein